MAIKRKMTQDELEAVVNDIREPEYPTRREGRTKLIAGNWRAGIDNHTHIQLLNEERKRLVPVRQPSMVHVLLDLLDTYDVLWQEGLE